MKETGPTPLWPPIEKAERLWREAGEPGWERLGLTATPTEQYMWLDDPNGPLRWPISS